MNLFRTTDTTDTTIWKPGFTPHREDRHSFDCPLIRGFLAFIRSSRSRFTLQCLLKGLSVSLWEYFLQIERDLQLLKVDRFSFGKADMAKIYERLLSTITPQGKDPHRFGPNYNFSF